MYSDMKNGGNVTPEMLRALLMCCYQLAMENSTSLCLNSQQIINAVVVSCVSKFIHTIQYKYVTAI